MARESTSGTVGESEPLRFGSLFAGIGGFDLSAQRSGLQLSWCAEIDKQCQSVLRRHFGFDIGWQLIKDVHHVSAADHVRPNIITGGFPCQDISVAGRRAGLAGKRSGLWWEFHRIIRDFLPAWVLIENVAGLLSSNGGRDLGAILRGLGQLGYGWAYRVFNAEWSGVPQRRRRVFIVGCFGDRRRAAEVLFERESLPWNSPPSREAGKGVTEGVAPSVVSNGDAHSGFRDERGLVAHALTAEGHDASEDGTGRGVPLVAQAILSRNGKGSDSSATDTFVCGPIQSHSQEHGHAMTTQQAAESGHLVPVVYQCQGSNVGPMGTLRAGNGNETGGVPFVFQTRIARNGRGQPDEVVAALTSCEGGTHADSKPHVATKFDVRRLTPRECERLFGLPDDWTRYGHDGKEISDSARYRMLGNSVAIPDVQWILERIRRAAT